MNYRHLYHAGNFGDVLKHAILVAAIERLKAKPAPFMVLDTHAGLGIYDLTSEAAQKTGEFRQGILRLLADPSPAFARYLDLVRAYNPGLSADNPLHYYPGSPQLAHDLLRPQDRLVLVELHPDDAKELRRRYGRDDQTAVHERDGFEAVNALVPPQERRGLVLIDPAFEARDELANLAQALIDAHRRWPTGILMAWYPIKDRPPVRKFHQEMLKSGIRRQLIAELLVQPDRNADALNGSGLLIINPPWQLDSDIRRLLPSLQARLGRTGARHRLEWLVGE